MRPFACVSKACMHADMYVCTDVYMHMYMYMHMHMHACMHASTHLNHDVLCEAF